MIDATGQGATLRVVVPWDPAILWPADGTARRQQASKYHAERDMSALKMVEGLRPRIFHTRRLRRSEMRDVSCMSSEAFQDEAGFVIGVTHIELADGRTARPANGERWSEADLDLWDLDYPTVTDIGRTIVQRSRIPLGLRVIYVEPHSSVDALVAWLSRSAALNPPDASPSKSDPAAPLGP